MDAIVADYRAAPIDEKLRAMLGLLEKLGRAPAEVSGADAREVLDAGVSAQGVREGLYVAALFEMITRLADSFGFAIPEDAAFEASAGSLLRFGYKL